MKKTAFEERFETRKLIFLIRFLNILIYNFFSSKQAAENQAIQFIKLIFILFRFKTLRMKSDRS